MSVFSSRHKLIALAVASALAPAAFAQSADKSDNVLPEVVVTSAPLDGIARNASVGSFSEAPLRETPASISVITLEQMQDRSIRTATDAVKYDASVQNSYNAVGLTDRLAIRGYEMDYSASYRKDGLVILGYAPIPLENKERLEILKGLAGLQAGIASSGGILNYVTKRPTNVPVRSVVFEVSERGTAYGAIDLSGRSDDGVFGYRINAAAADVRSYVPGSTGERQFISGAFDWRLSPRALLQVDMDYQHKSQLSVPGFQLLGGATGTIPTGVSAKTMLNNQSWSQPVVDDTNNLGVRFEYELNDNWRTVLSANSFTLRRDDAVALPFGFQANGEYTVVDLRRDNDKRSIMATQALLQGKFSTGGIRHEMTLGASTLNRRDNFADYLFHFKGTSNIYNPRPVADTRGPTNPVSLRRKDEERAVFMQDVLQLNDKFKLHAGLRYVQLERDQFNVAGTNRHIDDKFVLPNVALVYSPNANLSFYGTYAEGLEPGGEAPPEANNAGEAMDPSKSKQYEIGIKADISPDLNVTAALFEIKRPFEFLPTPVPAYEVAGEERRRGLELAANGRVTRDLLIGASMTTLLADVDGDARVAGKRIGNVPRYKAVVYGDYTMPSIPALRLNASLQYASSKLFAPNGDVQTRVSGYHVVNVGAQYKTKLSGVNTTFRFGINNLFDRFYWGDTANAFGGYLIPGAPRVFRLSAQLDF